MSKKGVAIDIDWIISLGVFLVYLGVFFLMIRQLPERQSPAASLLGSVADGVAESAAWQVQRLPLVISSNVSGAEPIITSFGYDWKNFSFTDNTSFDISEGKLIFAKQLKTGKNIAWLVKSPENYSKPATTADLAAGPNGVSIDSQRFVTEFQNSIITRASHFEKERLSDFNISISGVSFKPESGSAENSVQTISAKYKLVLPKINHTSFIVAGFSRIYSYVTTDATEPHRMLISATIRNYTQFHINNALSGGINYTDGTCTSSETRLIDFYDANSGLAFILPQEGNVTFCTGNTSIALGLEFPIGNETRYDMIFHPGDYNSTLKYVSPYRTAFGMIENVTGTSLSLYKSLNETDYAALKNRFGYPNSREFSFTLLNSSGAALFNYQPVIPGITNVFTREADIFVLDKYGAKTKHKLRIKGW